MRLLHFSRQRVKPTRPNDTDVLPDVWASLSELTSPANVEHNHHCAASLSCRSAGWQLGREELEMTGRWGNKEGGAMPTERLAVSVIIL